MVPATATYLRELRELCDARGLLLLVDAVQCGHFRSGSYQSFAEIVAGTEAEGFVTTAAVATIPDALVPVLIDVCMMMGPSEARWSCRCPAAPPANPSRPDSRTIAPAHAHGSHADSPTIPPAPHGRADSPTIPPPHAHKPSCADSPTIRPARAQAQPRGQSYDCARPRA